METSSAVVTSSLISSRESSASLIDVLRSLLADCRRFSEEVLSGVRVLSVRSRSSLLSMGVSPFPNDKLFLSPVLISLTEEHSSSFSFKLGTSEIV